MHCLQVLESFYQIYFSKRQVRIKKWFIFIDLLQILTKPCRASRIREHLSLNASWFSYARTQKYTDLLKNWFGKKYKKNFKVNNNNTIICAWYLSSKWPVCRCKVNQTTGGTSRTNLSTFLQTNILKYFALFCNKLAKIHLQ